MKMMSRKSSKHLLLLKLAYFAIVFLKKINRGALFISFFLIIFRV